MSKQNVIAMAAYLSDLAAVGRRAEAERKPLPDHPADFSEAAAPLVDRVRPLIAKIPPEALAGGVPLEWFRARLRGKYSRHALAGDVADALRQLGWRRRRGWQASEEGFRAKWYPPADSSKAA